MGSELSRGGALPALVGLCPDPAHTGEFYMPLDPHEGTICPECSEQLVVYVSTPWLIANGVGSGWLAGRGVAVGSNQYSEQRSNTAPTQGATAPSERESSPESWARSEASSCGCRDDRFRRRLLGRRGRLSGGHAQPVRVALLTMSTTHLRPVIAPVRERYSNQYSEQRSNAAPTPGATAPSERKERRDAAD